VAYLSISIVGLIGAPAGRAAYAILTLALVIPVVQQLRLESNVTFSMPTKGPSPESKGML
jgi:hypothetical protein